MMLNRCFITQAPTIKHDLDVLARWGSVVPLMRRGYFPDDVEIHTRSLWATCDKVMADFNPELDFVVPMGDSCTLSVVTLWLERKGLLPAFYLKYDKRHRGYYQIKIGEQI